jgi:hypothetical protein
LPRWRFVNSGIDSMKLICLMLDVTQARHLILKDGAFRYL